MRGMPQFQWFRSPDGRLASPLALDGGPVGADISNSWSARIAMVDPIGESYYKCVGSSAPSYP